MREKEIGVKKEKKFITDGADDTIKAAVYRHYSVKNGEDGETSQETLTSHSGKDTGRTVKPDTAKIAMITNSTNKKLVSLVDFSKTDSCLTSVMFLQASI